MILFFTAANDSYVFTFHLWNEIGMHCRHIDTHPIGWLIWSRKEAWIMQVKPVKMFFALAFMCLHAHSKCKCVWAYLNVRARTPVDVWFSLLLFSTFSPLFWLHFLFWLPPPPLLGLGVVLTSWWGIREKAWPRILVSFAFFFSYAKFQFTF